MKLVFLSNFYSHHQRPTCEEWYRLYGDNFTFVSTESISEERIKMGWQAYTSVPFEVKCCNGNQVLPFDLDSTDNVILGNAPLSMVDSRLKKGKLVFKYSERVFKSGYNYVKWLPRLYTYWKLYGRHKSLYLLTASAFASADFAMHGAFKNKSYKWGYFPETKYYDIKELIDNKDTNTILWCGRFVDWKHPEYAIEIAKRLKSDGVLFNLELIGSGKLQEEIQERIVNEGLTECVKISGAMSPEQVRLRMEKASIFIFTSDFNEGWGAVLNEAMNSGCAVVASHAIGSVPYLIKHRDNGLVYKNGNVDDLFNKVKGLLNDALARNKMAERAYETIVTLWNAQTAANRFVQLAEEIRLKGRCDLFNDGPCSRAPIIKNNWFKED